MERVVRHRGVVGGAVALMVVVAVAAAAGDDPPAIDPFGSSQTERDDAVPGYLELSDGSIHPGKIFLTREMKLRVNDETQNSKFRDVPLRVVKRIDCAVQKEWVEREWRFKENANDEKVYTGRNYPSREYVHTLTLNDGRTIRGPLQAIVFVQPEGEKPVRYLLHKRDKGEINTSLQALTYVRSVHLGEDALTEGKEKASRNKPDTTREKAAPSRPDTPRKTKAARTAKSKTPAPRALPREDPPPPG